MSACTQINIPITNNFMQLIYPFPTIKSSYKWNSLPSILSGAPHTINERYSYSLFQNRKRLHIRKPSRIVL